MSWLWPTLGYVLFLGIVGVAAKLALRSLAWQELLIWTALVYGATGVGLALFGGTRVHWEVNSAWALLAAALLVTSLICLYVALGSGETGKVVAISAAYPVVTLLLSALVLSEAVTLTKVGGVALVVIGAVLVSAG